MSEYTEQAEKTLDHVKVRITAAPCPDEPCARCWRRTGDVGVHDYWPTWQVCERCAGVLLEISARPFILRNGRTVGVGETGEADDPDVDLDYYICKDEKEWHDIKNGKLPLPMTDVDENGAQG
jgi:hypothetical protein